MAESIFNTKRKKGSVRAISAGIHPATQIQPETISILKEGDFHTHNLHPTLVTKEMLIRVDMVIAMDDWVADQLDGLATIVWDIPDPYKNPKESYQRTMDILIEKIDKLIKDLEESE